MAVSVARGSTRITFEEYSFSPARAPVARHNRSLKGRARTLRPSLAADSPALPRDALRLAPLPLLPPSEPALSRTGISSVTAKASSNRSTIPRIVFCDRLMEAARTNAESRAAIDSPQLSSSGRSPPLKYEASALTPPHSMNSNVDAPSPSSSAVRKCIATAAAVSGSEPAVRSGADAFWSRSTAPPVAAALKCAVRRETARSTAARRCGVSTTVRQDPPVLIGVAKSTLSLSTPGGTTLSRGVTFPPEWLLLSSTVASSNFCAQSCSIACTVPSFLNTLLNVSGSLSIRRSTR
mmetsp:Transcript_2664/g.8550  ORF Transcript_2664/g.8550 Transcript_2664/m.8550 type:complete len:294 (-) Transcript_2664:1463-2344(-)